MIEICCNFHKQNWFGPGKYCDWSESHSICDIWMILTLTGSLLSNYRSDLTSNDVFVLDFVAWISARERIGFSCVYQRATKCFVHTHAQPNTKPNRGYTYNVIKKSNANKEAIKLQQQRQLVAYIGHEWEWDVDMCSKEFQLSGTSCC